MSGAVSMVDAALALELANPGSHLSKALAMVPDAAAIDRELYIAFWCLGFSDGAMAQAHRMEILLAEGKQ